MRYFFILNLEHFVMYMFPALAFIALFILALGFYYIKRRDAAERESRIIERYADGIEGRNAPFPVFLYLTIAGTVIWVIAYILMIGLLKVKY
jgi:membrane protein DedA with SNARE-associated domain